MTVKTRSPYKRILQDIENGITPPIFEHRIIKKIRMELEEEFKNYPDLVMNEPHRKLVLHTFDYAQEKMEIEVKKIADNCGTFYRDVESEYALMIIEDIMKLCDTCEKALNMIELFVTNLMTVEEIEMILY